MGPIKCNPFKRLKTLSDFQFTCTYAMAINYVCHWVYAIKSTQINQFSINITVKLGYNEQLGASKIVRYNREFIITRVVYVKYIDLGLKICLL